MPKGAIKYYAEIYLIKHDNVSVLNQEVANGLPCPVDTKTDTPFIVYSPHRYDLILYDKISSARFVAIMNQPSSGIPILIDFSQQGVVGPWRKNPMHLYQLGERFFITSHPPVLRSFPSYRDI